MGSTRLPGKVLMDIAGRTLLARVVRRTMRAEGLDQVVVATTISSNDDPIVDETKRLGVEVFRGSEDDVLDRFIHAARRFEAEVICRITADCPLIDPSEIDRVIEAYGESGADYAGNFLVRTFPRGLDTEVFSMASLSLAAREAEENYERIHVTPFIYQRPKRFKLVNVTNYVDQSHYRWVVDTYQDYETICRIYESLGRRDSFSWLEALSLVESAPERYETNSCVPQKDLRDG